MCLKDLLLHTLPFDHLIDLDHDLKFFLFGIYVL